MVWRVTNEPVDCRPSRGTNKHTQYRKRCSLLDDNSTATADYDSAHANYTVNYVRQLQNHDYIHMTTITSYKSILLHVTLIMNLVVIQIFRKMSNETDYKLQTIIYYFKHSELCSFF